MPTFQHKISTQELIGNFDNCLLSKEIRYNNKEKQLKHILIQSLFLLVWFGNAHANVDDSSGSAVDPTQTAESELSEEQQYELWANQFLESIKPQTGSIPLPGGIATLEVPETFYYLSPEDSKRVLEEAWGNPEAPLGLGMLFPAKYHPLHSNSWGVNIRYEEEGYVSDEDAAEINYDELLKDMQADTREESKYRIESGYGAIELVNWATKPYYDSNTNKLYWAKEFNIDGAEENSLNYNVRALGRKGVLVMNFIAGMAQLSEIEQSRDDVLAMAEFNPGYRYSEFDPSMDKIAAYGIGGLVAGKVLAKTGMLAVGLVFLKKFWFVIFLPLLWLKNRFKKKQAEV